MTEGKYTSGPVETLARLAIQSDRYQRDPDFRDAVDNVLGVPVFDAAPDMLAALKGILSNAGGRCTAKQWQIGIEAVAKAEGKA